MDAALAVRRQAEAYQAAVGDLGEWLNSSASAPAAKEEKKDVQVVEEALLAKEMGNALVAKGRFEKALEAYTKSIALDPSQGMVYSNRALVWLKLSW